MTRQLSIGDYVITGGEIAAMVIVDSVARLQKGVLGNEVSIHDESHSGGLLEYAQYTRPSEFMGLKVPEVLLSGDHKKIEEFRRADALVRTLKVSPDMVDTDKLSEDDRKLLEKMNYPAQVAGK